MKTFEGRLVAEGLKVGIIVARFNEFMHPPSHDPALFFRYH